MDGYSDYIKSNKRPQARGHIQYQGEPFTGRRYRPRPMPRYFNQGTFDRHEIDAVSNDNGQNRQATTEATTITMAFPGTRNQDDEDDPPILRRIAAIRGADPPTLRNAAHDVDQRLPPPPSLPSGRHLPRHPWEHHSQTEFNAPGSQAYRHWDSSSTTLGLKSQQFRKAPVRQAHHSTMGRSSSQSTGRIQGRGQGRVQGRARDRKEVKQSRRTLRAQDDGDRIMERMGAIAGLLFSVMFFFLFLFSVWTFYV